MKMRLFIVKVVILLIAFIVCGGQRASSQQADRLRVGDTLSGGIGVKIVGSKASHSRMSDFRGQLLILDFWDIWCGSCIEAMPKMHRLQQLFGKEISILPVTRNKGDVVTTFAKKNRILSKLDFYSVVEDTVLHKTFPHTIIPHVAWIGKDGVVKAITGSTEVNEANIRTMLSGKDIALKEKKDVLGYDHTKPLLIGNNGSREDNYLQRSIITSKIDGIPSLKGGRFEDSDGNIRFRATNATILGLYNLAFRELFFLPNSKIMLEVADKSLYLSPKFLKQNANDSIAEDKERMYCYDLITPKRDVVQVRKSIKNDLDLFFGLNGRMEKRVIKCIVIKKDDKAIKATEPSGEKQKLTAFVNKFNNINGNPFIINECGGHVPMVPVIDLHIGFEAFREKLSEFGIECQQVEREMEVFVLSENN